MHFPFDRKVFDKVFWRVSLLAPVAWVAIYFIWGELLIADIVGVIITVPILSYLIHVILLMRQE